MNKKIISDALCGIDEKYLTEFDNIKKSQKGEFVMIKKFAVCAACLALIITAGSGLYKSGIFTKKIYTTIPEDTNTVKVIITESTSSEDNQKDSIVSSDEIVGVKDKETETNGKQPSEQANGFSSKGENNKTSDKDIGLKGGDTPEILQNYSIASDGASYYRVFHPAEDKFEPIKDMTLENRFCSFVYNKRSYSLAPDSDITKDDCEPKALSDAISSYWENRPMNPDKIDGIKIKGIEYRARIDIYKLKGVEPSEAVAGLISFNGETKLCKYNAK